MELRQRTATFVGRLGRFATFFVGSFLSLLAFGVGFSNAENFSIKGTEYSTNGGHNLNGRDRLKIFRGGRLIVVDVNGVQLSGVKNTLINLGNINASGGFAQGIESGSGNKVINRGRITANGGFAQGINGVYKNRFTNSGDISISGGFAQGINLETDNTLKTTGNIRTNGGFAQGINAVRANKITNKGDIRTSGGFARGVNLEKLNTFNSTGNIITSGGSAQGIYAAERNKITNRGTISTNGGFAQGIFAEESNRVTNSGKIYTNGGFAQGIHAQAGNRVTNNGNITTHGDFSQGIFAGNNNHIDNRKNIRTHGKFGQGIQIGDGNRITNSGLIKTSGNFAQAIHMGNRNRLVNTGTISASGGFAQAIRAGNNNTIINSGRIISSNVNAIELGDSNTLHIKRGSVIVGGIDVGTNATVKIAKGHKQSVLWDFSQNDIAKLDVETSPTIKSFHNQKTKKLATYNSRAARSVSNQAAEFSGLLGSIAQQRLDLAFAPVESNADSPGSHIANSYVETQEQAYSSRIDKAFGQPGLAKKPKPVDRTRKIWASLFGGVTHYNGRESSNDQEISSWGFAAGFDWASGVDQNYGFMLGYNQGQLTAENQISVAYDNQNSGLFTSFFGRRKIENSHIDFSVSGGFNRHTDMRSINDNLVTGGFSYASASYDSYWISPFLKYGIELPGKNEWSYIPSIGIRYTSQWLQGYQETGSNANATASSRHVANLEPSVEWASKRNTTYGWAKFRLGYIYRLALGDATSRMTILGQTNEITSRAEKRHIGYFGINSNFALTDNLSLELGGKVSISDGLTGYDGKARLIMKF